MPPKVKSETEFEFMEAFTKMTEMFERFTSKIVDQINANFDKHADMLKCEIFNLKETVDKVAAENAELKTENDALKKQIGSQNKQLCFLEEKIDGLEQNQFKDDVVLTGDFQIDHPTPTSIAFIKKTSDCSLSPNSISNFYATKEKLGKTMLKITINNRAERISLLKSRKTFAQKIVFVNEVLTSPKYQLLMAAKALCKEKKLFAAWSRDGKIFIKKNEQDGPHMVPNIGNLRSLVGV